jgi:hypothetical protein
MCTTDLKQVDKSEEFTAGQTILVRDYFGEGWPDERVFICYGNDPDFPYVCEHSIYGKSQPIKWKQAKALTK